MSRLIPPIPYFQLATESQEGFLTNKVEGGYGSGSGRYNKASSKPKIWLIALWPLILHFILAIGTAAFIILYLNQNNFHLTDRRPTISLVNGGKLDSKQSAPTQPDITTLISATLAILRLITACWAGPLCWRCALILMERTGMKHTQLNNMISYGVPTVPITRDKTVCILVWVVLIMVLPAQVVAPVLTGSITWVPSYRLTGIIPGSVVEAPTVTVASNQTWEEWNIRDVARQRVAVKAVGYSNIAWGRDTPNESSKRVLRSLQGLAINSTITNVTLPYFSVESLQWIQDPSSTLTAEQLDIYGRACPYARPGEQVECPLKSKPGSLALVPTEISNSAIETPHWGPFPSPSLLSERRLLVVYSHWRRNSTESCNLAENKLITRRMSGEYPPDMGFYAEKAGGECWAFAWVNFTAAVGECSNCRVSSYETVQNDTSFELRPDSMTSIALRLMPTVSSMMALENTSIASSWNNVNNYTVELLARSYAVSWAALLDSLGESDLPLTSTYTAAIPSSRADVNLPRVYIWLGIQSLITLSGLIFLVLQTFSGSPMIADTTLVPFYLDTTDMYVGEKDQGIPGRSLLRLFQGENRLKVRLD